MGTTEELLAAWRVAEAAVENAKPGTTAHRHARVRADVAKTAYLAHVDDVFDIEGHPSHGATARPAEDRSTAAGLTPSLASEAWTTSRSIERPSRRRSTA